VGRLRCCRFRELVVGSTVSTGDGLVKSIRRTVARDPPIADSSGYPRLILALGQGAMPDSDQRPEVEAPEELLADRPLPSDAKTFFLGGIFVLLMLTVAYVASEIVLPMIFAVMLNLLMQPALRALERLRTPRALGALLLVLVMIATIVGLGAAVSRPAEAWIAKLPEGIPRILDAAEIS
jgi:hypothetical protein